jgi:hypothetical protein
LSSSRRGEEPEGTSVYAAFVRSCSAGESTY